MANVIATHAVGNMDTWLAGGAEREEIFSTFCSGYSIFRHPEQNRVSLIWRDVDMERFETAMKDPKAVEGKVRHTVLDPIDIYVEVDGGR